MRTRDLARAGLVAVLAAALLLGPAAGTARSGDDAAESPAVLVGKIETALRVGTLKSLQEAADLLRRLERACDADGSAESVGLEDLRKRVADARDACVRTVVQSEAFAVLARLTLAKAREAKRANAAAAKPGDPPAAGTFAAAREWARKSLAKEIRTEVARTLEITAREFDGLWMNRSRQEMRTASYGSATFLVRVRNAPAGSDEAWWDENAKRPEARAAALTAWFVESDGMFDVVVVDESATCDGCAGRGVVSVKAKDGTLSKSPCTTCRGAAKVRTISYR